MKTILIMVGLVACFNSYAFRCGTHLINEGDTATRMVALCGEPEGHGQNLSYTNLNGDGMNYYIHCDASGVIDSITFSRGD